MRDAQLERIARRSPDRVQLIDHAPRASFARDAIRWLAGETATIPAKYLYDPQGAAWFERICATPEYYLPRLERPLLKAAAAALGNRLGPNAQLVEFGSGGAEKARLLLERLPGAPSYVAIDIARDQLIDHAQAIADRLIHVEVIAVCADFSTPIPLPAVAPHRRRCGFFPGSTIGNLAPDQAVEFLRQAEAALGPTGMFLIGVDLVKDRATLEAAYDDRAGVSAAFSLNLATRMARELNAGIDPADFCYQARFNPGHSRIEMLWQSRRDHHISIGEHRFPIKAGQELLVEISHKYSLESFTALAARAQYRVHDRWVDPSQGFALFLLCPAQVASHPTPLSPING